MSLDRANTYSALGHVTLGPSVTGFIDLAFSDSVDINYLALGIGNLEPRAFAVFSTGDLKITTVSGKTDIYVSGELIVGQIYPEAIRRVFATGTTATKMRIYF